MEIYKVNICCDTKFNNLGFNANFWWLRVSQLYNFAKCQQQISDFELGLQEMCLKCKSRQTCDMIT